MPDPFKQELILKENFENFMEQKVIMLNCPTYEDYFFRVKTKGIYKGTIYGFPFTVYKTCARILKWEPMQKFSRQWKDSCFLLGIAKGENRNILEPNKSLLLEYGLTESEAYKLCIENNLLNPLYKYFKRLGWVRCPKQSIKALRIVKKLEPEKYQWMLDHDDLSPVKFKPKYTFKQVDEMVKQEQIQLFNC